MGCRQASLECDIFVRNLRMPAQIVAERQVPAFVLRRVLRRCGYFQVKSTMEFVVKINAVDVAPSFYESTENWHVTLGDSDQDR